MFYINAISRNIQTLKDFTTTQKILVIVFITIAVTMLVIGVEPNSIR